MSLEGGSQALPAGGARVPDSAPRALLAFRVGPRRPSIGPSPEPERDWWQRLSLGGRTAWLLRSCCCCCLCRRGLSSIAGGSDSLGNRLAMGSGAAADLGCGKVSQTRTLECAAAGHS